MTVIVSCDGQINAPKGVHKGESGRAAATYKIDRDGREEKLPGVVECVLEKGEWVRGLDSGGGGYGSPLERDPERVCSDVLEHWETPERARDIYGVVLTIDPDDGTVSVDSDATEVCRREMAGLNH